jgi:deoxyribose-phosphate aldolase
MKPLNSYIDHTLLRPDATVDDILKLCDEAKKYKFYAVCVNSCYVYLASRELKKSKIKIAATVGFPLGAASTKSKVAEARRSVKDGAHEIDMVLNIGFLKSGLLKNVKEDIAAVKKAIGKRVLKVILETCYLSDDEKKLACEIAKKAGADFVKTSTGFGPSGATLADVQLMKSCVGDAMKIKASGGISTQEEAMLFIAAGADRIGTSKGISLLSS